MALVYEDDSSLGTGIKMTRVAPPSGGQGGPWPGPSDQRQTRDLLGPGDKGGITSLGQACPWEGTRGSERAPAPGASPGLFRVEPQLGGREGVLPGLHTAPWRQGREARGPVTVVPRAVTASRSWGAGGGLDSVFARHTFWRGETAAWVRLSARSQGEGHGAEGSGLICPEEV